MNEELPNPTPPSPQDFTDVVRIAESRGVNPHNVGDLDQLVEAPLLPAARLLYERGLHTIESSANPEADTDGYGKMTIEYDTLSEDNKRQAEKLAQANAHLSPESRPIDIVTSGDGYTAVVLHVPLQGSVDEIVANATAIAEQFAPQPMHWAPRYTLEELKKWYSIPEHESVEVSDFAEEFYYDKASGLFFLSEDHARRALAPDPSASR